MEKEELNQRQKKKGMSKFTIAILAVIAVCLIIILLLGMRLLNSVSRSDELIFEEAAEDFIITPPPATPSPTPESTPSPTATPEPTPLPMEELYQQTRHSDEVIKRLDEEAADERYINVLLLGVDRRGGKSISNTDVMMVATIDTVNNRLKLTTLMRDMLVNIPGEGYGKLNSAAVKGGMELLFETLNTNFHLNLSEYVLVDFRMFEEVVDALGGVTVRMTAEEISAANDCIAGLNKERGIEYLWDGFIFANEGNVKLTGKQALGYARVRKIDSDFSRTNRKFKILNSVFARFMKADAAKQYSLLEKVLPLVETNMTNQRIIECATKALGMDVAGLQYCRVPFDDTYKSTKYERKSVVMVDVPANALAMHDFIFLSADEVEEAKLLTPGESLPPRTPTIYQGADGNYYYYSNNMPVPTEPPVYYGDPQFEPVG